MEIKHEDNGTKGRFYYEFEGEEVAFMTYQYAGPEKFIIEHTIVAPEFEGKGLASKLVAAGVDFAREKKLLIIPLCPYANMVFKRKPEYADVLY